VPTQVERSEQTRRRVLDAATGLYTERGWASTSLEEVAAAAGVTKGALYHHFAGKTDLLRAVYEDLEERFVTRLAALPLPPSDPVEALRAGARAFLAQCLEPSFCRIALIDAPAALGWSEWRAIDARFGFGMLQAAVAATADAGRLRALSVNQVSHVLLAALMEAALLIAHDDNPAAALEEAATTFDALLDGLLATP
jgi:AcrR family transcriptional regulator